MQPPRKTGTCSFPGRHRLLFFLAIVFVAITLGPVVGGLLDAGTRSASSNASFSSASSFSASFDGATSNASFSRNGENTVAITLSSTSFPSGGEIPKKFTCDGQDVSPDLSWNEAPAGTKSFALLADDPDAPVGNWNHWTLWNVPPESRSLPEGASKGAQLPDGSQQGLNDFRKVGYNGPCPPPGKPHRYYFKLFALDAKLTLKEKSGKRELETAMKGHILAQAEWMGRFGRK